MAPSLEAADTICDTLNVHVDLNRDQWKCLASAAFYAVETAKEQAASEAKTAASGRTVAHATPTSPGNSGCKVARPSRQPRPIDPTCRRTAAPTRLT